MGKALCLSYSLTQSHGSYLLYIWYAGSDLNRLPVPYEGTALPLSYAGFEVLIGFWNGTPRSRIPNVLLGRAFVKGRMSFRPLEGPPRGVLTASSFCRGLPPASAAA